MPEADALSALGAQPASSGPSLQQLYQAARNPWLSEQDRALVNSMIQQKTQEQDPLRQLQLMKARIDLQKAQAGDGADYKVVNDRLIKTYPDGRVEDVTPSVPEGAGPTGPFSGSSVEAQSLNLLVANGRLTPEQAAQIGAGKPITDPSTGAIIFMTPEGIFQQERGQQPQPLGPQGGGSQLLAPMPLGGSGQMQPRPQQAPVPQPAARPGAIPLTPPKAAKEPTDGERNAMTFADRMRQSGSVIDQSGDTATGVWSNAVTNNAYIPDILENMLVSSDFQKYDQARRDFVNAVLRRESGAVISAEEFENANRQYFPQPGDSKDVIEQKKRNRQTVIDGMTRAGGKTYQPGALRTPGGAEDVPAGVDPADWEFMTPEERAEFQ